MPAAIPPGWYPDPQGRARARWWDGVWWSAWESDGAQVWRGAPAGPARRPKPPDVPAFHLVRTVLLPEAQRRGVLPDAVVDALAGLADELAAEAVGHRAMLDVLLAPPGPPQPRYATPEAPPQPRYATPEAPPQPTVLPAELAILAPSQHHPRPGPPPPRAPGRLARWWATSKLRLDTDLTVHGLTYLGVLLLFVGVFGLVAFAFGDVAPGMRPVAELAVAAVPFVAAALLARSGARFVARAMVAVGGLILPLMVVTSTVDGYDFPPDLRGLARPVGTALACAVIAAAYALRVHRRRDSALGVMIAPVLWLAAAMGAIALGRPVPSGQDVATPGAAQVAVIALVLLATTWLAARWISRNDAVHPADDDAAAVPDDDAPAPTRFRTALAIGARAAAPAGVVVVGVLAVVASVAEGWPLVPVLVTTSALAIATGYAFPRARTGVWAAAWLAVALRVLNVDADTALLSPDVPAAGAALDARPALLLATLLVGTGLLELLTRDARRAESPDTGAVAFGVVGWALAVLAFVGALSPDGIWWGLGGAVALTVWAAWRRIAPPELPGAAAALDAIAIVAPIAVVAGVWLQVDGGAAGLLVAALALAATPLARGRLRRGPGDLVWYAWWIGAIVVTVLATFALADDGLLTASSAAARAVLPVMIALAVVAVVSGPARPPLAIALVTPLVWWLGAAVVVAADWASPTLALIYAALGVVAVAAAHAGPRVPDDADAPRHSTTALALALAGYATGLAAFVPDVEHDGAIAAALGAGTLAWLITAVAGDLGRSPVVGALDRANPPAGPLAWVLVLLGLPATTVAALHAARAVQVGDAGWAAPLIVAALGYAVVTRIRVPRRLRPALPWVAFGLAVLAVLVTPLSQFTPPVSADRWAPVVALAVLALVAPVAKGRHPVMVWVAWIVLAPLAGVAVYTGSVGARDLDGGLITTAALVAVGGLLAIGGLVADRARPTDPRVLPRRPAARPPFVVGAVQLGLGTVFAPALSDPEQSGILLLVAAGLAAVAAALNGIGVVGATAALVAWVGVRLLLADAYSGAWADVVVVAVLLLAALAASLAPARARARWARWDVPLAWAAVVPAVVALVVVPEAERSPVYVTVGLLAVAAAVRLARLRGTSETLGQVGSLLVLLGAAWAGREWAAGALAWLAVAHTALAALRETGQWRSARQWLGAVLAAAAWLVLIGGGILGGTQAQVDLTAIGAAAVALGVVGLVAAGLWDRSWAVSWGSVAATLAVAACLAPTSDATYDLGVTVGWWQVAALALLALAAVLAGQVVAPTAWRVIAVAPALAALLVGFGVAAATPLARVTVSAVVSLLAAVVVVVVTRTGRRADPSLLVLGATMLAVAGAFALAADGVRPAGGPDLPRPVLVAAVLAVAAVQAAVYGVVLRKLGLRVAAPLVAWLAWATYAADAVGGVVVWYTIPVGLAMLVAVGVWRSDRRERGLPASEPGVVALELAGIAFLVVASFVAAFTTSVLHALGAAGIGVLVFLWAVLTRVRRRLLAGGGIVLAGVVVAAVLPLVALVPAWGGPAMWVLVAVIGLLVVLAATFLERGRAAVVSGRTRLYERTEGWE